MQESENFDFSEVSNALTYFRNLRFDLFSQQSLSDPIHIHNAKLLSGWSGSQEPARLTGYLHPDFIRRQIIKTEPGIQGKNLNSNVTVERLNPDDYIQDALVINYSFSAGRFGKMLLASTSVGICFIGFADAEEDKAMEDLIRRFPFASVKNYQDEHQLNAINYFKDPLNDTSQIKLHLKGTPFQFAIWNKLLQIPLGGLVSYGSLTEDVKSARATGTAVGDNPVAYLVPCHRVVRANGEFGPYFWGADRKAVLISWEAYMLNN